MMRNRRNWFVGALLMLAGGCTSTVIPPKRVTDPAAVFLTDYGRHSSLLLPDREGRLVEYAFGDWDWFAVNKNKSTDALRALFASRGSTLGRRVLPNVDETVELARLTNAAKVSRFEVERERALRLQDDLSHAYRMHAATEVFNPASSLYFVRVPENYWMFHNCNHVAARWM